MPVPGVFLVGVPNIPKWWVPYRTYRSVEYRTELTEVLGTGIQGKCARWGIPVPGVFLGGRAEHTQVLSTVPNLPKCWVPVCRGRYVRCVPVPGVFLVDVPNTPKWWVPYRTYKSVGYRTELTEVLGTGMQEYVYSVGYTGARGILGGRTELTEVSCTSTEFVPIFSTGVFGRVLRPTRTLPKTRQGIYRANTAGIFWYVPHRTHPKLL